MRKGYFHNIIRYMLALLPFIFSMNGCDVHEFPEDVPSGYTEEQYFSLHIDCNIEVPLHYEVEYGTRSEDYWGAHDVRYILNVYRSEDGHTFTREADTTIIFTKEIEDSQEHTLTLSVQQGVYNFIVWRDYVDDGTNVDKYYNTSSFETITYANRENHIGCNDFKDAFQGSSQAIITIDPNNYKDTVHHKVEIEMERPFAKFKIVSTDYAEFVGRTLEKLAHQNEEVSKTINPDDYRVVLRYTGFMPCSFNMFTNRPNDSWTGMWFEGKMIPIDNNEVELGFDYVFVNGTESAVEVAVEVYDRAGELLSRSKSMSVPLVRSKLTVVSGDFLTTMTSGGFDISTDYDGDFNIEIK